MSGSRRVLGTLLSQPFVDDRGMLTGWAGQFLQRLISFVGSPDGENKTLQEQIASIAVSGSAAAGSAGSEGPVLAHLVALQQAAGLARGLPPPGAPSVLPGLSPQRPVPGLPAPLAPLEPWLQRASWFAPSYGAGATLGTTADTYVLCMAAPQSGRIVSAVSLVASGTETYTITINGVNVTGLVTIAEASIAAVVHAATGANFFAKGAIIRMVVTGAGLGFSITLRTE